MLYDNKGFIYKLDDIKKELRETRCVNNDINFKVICLEWDIENIIEEVKKLGDNEVILIDEKSDSKLSILETSYDSSKL